MSYSLKKFQVGDSLMLAPDAPTSNLHKLYANGLWYEADLLAEIKRRQTGGIFVDIGAGLGNHTVHFAMECKADCVIAVESHPGCLDLLLQNVELNGLQNVEILRAHMHPTWKYCTLSTSEDELWHWSRQPTVTEGGDVKCWTLDDLLEYVHPAVIKIDIESAGVEILATGMEVVARSRPLIAIEANLQPERDAVAALLEPLDYECLGMYCWTPTYIWVAK